MNLANLSRLSEIDAYQFIERIRWPNGVKCVHCLSKNVSLLMGKSTRPGLYKCYKCRKQFTVKVGTVFECSSIPLRDWVYVFARMCASKKGISAHQIHRELGITYVTAWFMCMRIRHCLVSGGFGKEVGKLSGTIEVDETYVGGKPRFKGWHIYGIGMPFKVGRGTDKQPVLAMVSRRSGKAITKVIPNVSGTTLKPLIRKNVSSSSRIFTDEWPGYRGIGKHFQRGHETVNHKRKEYVRLGTDIHTNTVESFFAILKRTIGGTHHHVSKKHLQKYCNEMAFKWTNRRLTDVERVKEAIRHATGKRLSYERLTK